jgi:hypothetical protein
MDKKVARNSESTTGRVESSGTGWRVAMVKHPQTGLYFAAGFKRDQ